jgi:uncharacterized repeat protein (TIGR01451 family)
MKKAWVVISLVSVALFSGCRGPDALQDTGDARTPAAASGRGHFWDKDLRPIAAVPAQPRSRQQQQQQPVQPPVELRPRDQVARTEVEPIHRARTAQPELLTASVEELQPVGFRSVPPAFARAAPVGRDLVAIAEPSGSSMTIVYPRPDYGILQVDKAMPTEVRLDTPFTYVVRVTNLTDMMLTEITITETLSRDFTFQSSEPVARVEQDRLIWQIEQLAPRANRSIRITGVATAARQLEYCTAITHTARDCTAIKVVEPTLELVKIAPAEALLCEPIQVEFVVTNTGTGAAHNIQIVDTLPTGLQTTDGKGKIVLEAGTLAAGESRRFSIKLRAAKVGTYINKATATSATGLQAESEATLTNVRQPVLTITKSGPRRQFLGRPVTYEMTVTNRGDGPAQNTMIEDIIPPGVTSIEATAGAQSSGSKLIWELGTLQPNTSKTVRVSYTPTREGELMATATASAYCAEPVTDSARTAITGIAAARVEVIDLEDPVEVGGTTTYLITVTNEGSAADSNIRISALLDEKLQYVSSAGATAGSIMGRTVSFAPLRTLEPKGKATWRIVVRGLLAGDARVRVTMHTDQLALPVEQTEATHIYQQFINGN